MIVGSQLEKAQLENKATNPATQAEGLIYYNTTNKKPVIDDGVSVSEIQLEKHLESTLDSKNLKGKVAARDTYANLLALPRVAGLLYEATDLGSVLFDDGTNLNEIGGAGNGSVNTFHQQIFETEGESYFSTIDGSWTKEDETTAQLRGTRSVKFTQVVGSLGARQVSEIIELEEDQKGSKCGHFFRYKTANSEYYEVTIEESDDGTTFTKVPNSKELILVESKRSGAIYYIPKETSTHVRLSFKVLVESVGHELIVDSIEATTNPLQTVMFDYTRDSVKYSPVVDIVGTVTSSQAFYYKVANKAKFTGQVVIGSTASGSLNLSLPEGILFDSSNLPTTNSSFGKLGEARWYNASAPSNGQKLWVCYNADDKFFFKEEDGTPFDGTFLDNGDSIYYDFEAPIQGWSAYGEGVVTDGQPIKSVTFSAQRTTSQTLANGASTVIQYNNIINDSHSGWNGVDRYIVPEDGDYQVQVFSEFSPNSSGVRQVNVTGTAIAYDGNLSSGSGTILDGQVLLTNLSKGYEIIVDQFQNSGVSLNAGNSGGVYNRIEIFKINPSTDITVISPFKTEITTGTEYKTGEVIDGKDVYEYVYELSADIGGNSSAANIVDVSSLSIGKPIGHTKYFNNGWLIDSGHFDNGAAANFGFLIYFDEDANMIRATVENNWIIGTGTTIRFKYTK
jgi:hypothetical protein